MNKLNYLLFLMLFTASFVLISQTLSFDPKTGDKRFDKQLHDINANLSQNLGDFKQKVSYKYNIKESKVSDLLSEMEPAEVLITLQLLTITSKSLDEILESYKENRRAGWKAIAEDLGIENNTAAFRELKNVILFNEMPVNDNSLSQR